MKSKSLKTIRGTKRLVSITAICAALVTGLGVVPNTSAYSVVEVGPNQVWNLLSKVEAALEYTEENTRWYTQLQEYRNMLSTLYSEINNFNLVPGQPLSQIPENQFVAETCGSSGFGAVVKDGISSLSLDKGGDYLAQQKNICARIQILKNRRYNETVQFTNKYVPQVQDSISKISGIFNSERTVGGRDGAQYELTKTSTELGTAAQDWKNRMEMYEQSIKSLEDRQRSLAQMALKGNNSVVGTIVKTATLKGALEL